MTYGTTGQIFYIRAAAPKRPMTYGTTKDKFPVSRISILPLPLRLLRAQLGLFEAYQGLCGAS